jgi:predicted O-methyltransferase YrrM
MGLYQKIIKNLRLHVYPRIPLIGKYLANARLVRLTYEPGHYYSPVVVPRELKGKENRIFNKNIESLPGIELNKEEQFSLLNKLAGYYPPPFPVTKDESGKLRYYYRNDFYPESDAIFLYSIIRHFRPKRIIEAGSGFSSAVMLDTNEHFPGNQIDFCFIEPYPKRLLGLLKTADKAQCRILEQPIQDVPLAEFEKLEANDILFIDSTHVSKTGSDVNYILFEILPRLNKGVLVHFHDIFYPFEYPKNWVTEFYTGFGWNESYILRAFLQYNNAFKIILFNTFLQQVYRDWFSQHMPLCLQAEGGNIWIQKQ